MADTLFYRSSLGAFEQVTNLFRFVWPTAAALWNLRWQVDGYIRARPDGPEDELRHRFVAGSGIQGVDLRTACLEHSWEQQQSEFAGFILIQACALYEAWLEGTLRILALNDRNTGYLKNLQFPTGQKAGKPTGYAVVLAKIQSPVGIGSQFRTGLRKHRKNAWSSLQALLQCYRYFKECRNDIAHGGGRASDDTVAAFAVFNSLTAKDLGLREKPQAQAPSLGGTLALSLRGVVGFTDVVLRLIATLDAELAMCARSDDELASRWIDRFGRRVLLKGDSAKRDKQVLDCTRGLGLPEPDAVEPLITLLRDRRLVRW